MLQFWLFETDTKWWNRHVVFCCVRDVYTHFRVRVRDPSIFCHELSKFVPLQSLAPCTMFVMLLFSLSVTSAWHSGEGSQSYCIFTSALILLLEISLDSNLNMIGIIELNNNTLNFITFIPSTHTQVVNCYKSVCHKRKKQSCLF